MEINMKRIIPVLLVICIAFSFTGCSNGEKDARQALETYTQNLANGDYDAAYEQLSSFDKGNISKELFLEWQNTVAKIEKIESFTIDKKVDKFKNYKYMGTTFNKAYGFKVKRVNTLLLKDIKTSGYDSDEYMIMVTNEDDSYKIALLITKLEETIKNYNRQMS
jgi:NTF2-like N-terminal transpeptidase domain.